MCKDVECMCVCVRACDHANNMRENEGMLFLVSMDGHNDGNLCDLCVDCES